MREKMAIKIRHMAIRQLFFLIVCVIAASVVFSIPGLPNQFFGTVNYDTENPVITARIDGIEVLSIIAINNTFGYYPDLIWVQDPDGTRNGKTVEFFIDGQRSNTVAFAGGANTNLDLQLMPEQGAYCGDKICNAQENCKTCSRDCGSCSHGSYYNGYVKTKKNMTEKAAFCRPDWYCTDWLPCVDGTQKRLCGDMNKCNDETTRPVMEQSCTVQDLKEKELTQTEAKKYSWQKLVLPIAILVCIFVLGYLSYQMKRKK